MIGALILGLVAGFIGRAIVPRDAFRHLEGPTSIAVSIVLGLAGALLGYFIFSKGLGIGDDDAFDLGGLVSAMIGVVILLIVLTIVMNKAGIEIASKDKKKA